MIHIMEHEKTTITHRFGMKKGLPATLKRISQEWHAENS